MRGRTPLGFVGGEDLDLLIGSPRHHSNMEPIHLHSEGQNFGAFDAEMEENPQARGYAHGPPSSARTPVLRNTSTCSEKVLPSVDMEEDDIRDADHDLDVDMQQPSFTHSGAHGLLQVRVRLVDLVWGGEFIEVPFCQAFGYVIGHGGLVDNKEPFYEVDFRDHLGVQRLPVSKCRIVEEGAGSAEEGEDVTIPEVKSAGFDDTATSSTDDNSDGSAEDIVDLAPTEAMPPCRNQTAPPQQSSSDQFLSTSSEPHLSDSEGDSDWEPGRRSESEGLSDSGSDACHLDIDPVQLLGELGMYGEGPHPKCESWEDRYQDANWHARSWSLHPRMPFGGPEPGPTVAMGDEERAPIDYFLLLWDERVQRKVVSQSNLYADYRDPISGKRKGGDEAKTPITLSDHRKFLGICALMAGRRQPSMRSYWRRESKELFSEDVSDAMSRWRFEYVLRCLHLTPKQTFVTDKGDPNYDPIGKVRWLMDALIANYRFFLEPITISVRRRGNDLL